MKTVLFVTALAVGMAIMAAPADAAKKRKRSVVSQPAITSSHVVRDNDGAILGQDPDPFIRLMILREGKIRDQSGP